MSTASTAGTPPADTATLAALHARLVAAAAEQDLLDLAYRTVDSPIGALLVAATPRGVVRVAFELEGHDDVLTALSTTVSPRVLHAPQRLDAAARELDEYFTGRRTAFDLPVDLRLAQGFRLRVIEWLRTIPFGGRASYAAVAVGVDNPKAVRAVGTACATNPVPVIIPCHRVVRSDGSTGAYRGGPEAKAELLAQEAAVIRRGTGPNG